AGGLLDHNPNSAEPFRLGLVGNVTCDQDHNYADEQKAYNGGGMNKFPETVGTTGATCYDAGKGKGLVMGYYDGNQVTALWNYAQNFAMSDRSFSTTFGPSTPGALNLISGNTHGAMIVADSFGNMGSAAGNVTAIDANGVGSVIGDPRPGPALDDCTLPSSATSTRTYIRLFGRNVGDLLTNAGVTWGWFQGGFRPATTTGVAGAAVPGICQSFHSGFAGPSYDYIPHHEPFQYYAQTSNPHHLAPSSASTVGHQDQANHQYDLADFFAAVDAGNLPAVSFLKAAAYQDGHAGYSDPLDEQVFLVNTINHLMQTPEWEHTAIVVLYDDSDGWYDHVMGPIVNQSNTPDDGLFGAGNCGTAPAGTFEGRCGYGPRQPLLVVSPWAKQNFVDHNVTDQSSVIRFIEDNWGLGRLGNQSTDAIAGDLGNLFDFNPSHFRAPQLILNATTGNP
ncbi:MAG TPA: alkaline phosphatase family protein, partial [Vicinamibacterales bacterium]|nr:alkaline phosphatase family protein [Vicinamibacterales bacterium]